MNQHPFGHTTMVNTPIHLYAHHGNCIHTWYKGSCWIRYTRSDLKNSPFMWKIRLLSVFPPFSNIIHTRVRVSSAPRYAAILRTPRSAIAAPARRSNPSYSSPSDRAGSPPPGAKERKVGFSVSGGVRCTVYGVRCTVSVRRRML